MASAFGHALASTGISIWNPSSKPRARFWVAMAAVAIFPDIDAIGFFLGVPYGSMWGHRGITHSILFAGVTSVWVAHYFFKNRFKVSWFFLFLAMLSHGLLDACTSGGLGVGFFIPFCDERYFFPFHPILVSPIGVSRFFSVHGLRILESEIFWIGIPVLLSFIVKKVSRN